MAAGCFILATVSLVAIVAGLVEGWRDFRSGRLAGSELFLDYERDGNPPPPRNFTGK